MANGRKFPALREHRQFLDGELHAMRIQLEAEGGQGGGATRLIYEIERKQHLFDEVDYIIERYGSEQKPIPRVLFFLLLSLTVSAVILAGISLWNYFHLLTML